MIYYNKQIEKPDLNHLCIVMDFDNTLTSGDSISSYGVFQNKNIMGEKYCKECLELNSKYIEAEKDYKINEKIKNTLMEEWAEKSIELLTRYQISQEIVDKVVYTEKMKLRPGLKDFFLLMKKNKIPVIIISAGIGNVIEAFLRKEGILFDNITVIGNFFDFSKRVINIKDKMIHTSNKNEIRMQKEVEDIIKTKGYIVLIGDTIEDVNIIYNKLFWEKKILKIGFLNDKTNDNLPNYNKEYDIVFTNGGTFNNISDILLT